MQWSTSVADLRSWLNDGPTDKLASRKRCLGRIEGANKIFKTFEFRRVTNLTTADSPFGVYVGPTQMGTLVTVDADNVAMGEFILNVAPDGPNTVVEATYYYQYFLDSELAQFLKNAAQWLGGTDALTIAPGLQPAALAYASFIGMKKLAQKSTDYISQTYLLQDQPGSKNTDLISNFIKLADEYFKDATKMRDDFYTRQGQSLAPLFGTVVGNIKDPSPMR